jgi:hypothetical protein
MARFLFLNHLQDGYPYLDPNAPRENMLIVANERVPAPRVQGPGLRYSKDQIMDAMRVLDHSLSWLKGRFPNIPTTLVYIPSPASIYRFATFPRSRSKVTSSATLHGMLRSATAQPFWMPDPHSGEQPRHSSFMARLIGFTSTSRAIAFLATLSLTIPANDLDIAASFSPKD